tara:strand:- start:24 stop:272 length:249 start_codon:yes stop_codon:yes gene_type:complete
MTDEEKIWARIPRDANKEAIIKTLVFWKTDVLDIRWWDNGKPTGKGFRCNMDEAKILHRALTKIIGDKNEDKQEFNEDEIEE